MSQSANRELTGRGGTRGRVLSGLKLGMLARERKKGGGTLLS